MAGSINKVILVGNLGKDPEIRSTRDGRKIANLNVATSETWRDKTSGEKREKTEWHRVVIFSEGLTKVAESYLQKGSKVYIEGQLQTRKWQDDKGGDHYATEVVLNGFGAALVILGGGRSREGDNANNDDEAARDREYERESKPAAVSKPRGAVGDTFYDQDIPFAAEVR